MFQELQFREYYGHLADDELARIALTDELVPEARQALKEELQKRGLTDLSEYKTAVDQAAADRREEAKGAREDFKLHIAALVFMYVSVRLLYYATGWLGIHNGDARAVITIVLSAGSLVGFAALWRRIRDRAKPDSP
jgi:hypothetical protein